MTDHALGKHEKPKAAKKQAAKPAVVASPAPAPTPAKPVQKPAPIKTEPKHVFQEPARVARIEEKPVAAHKPLTIVKPSTPIGQEILDKAYQRWSPHFGSSDSQPKEHYSRYRHEEERDGMDQVLAQTAEKAHEADQKIFE